MRKTRLSGIALAAMLPLGITIASLNAPVAAQREDDRDRDPLVDLVANGKGRINYSAGVVKATGYGAMPGRTASSGQAKLMARGAARADALRNLAMAVSSVQVTATTRVKNYVLENDVVETRVTAMLQSPRVVSERDLPDGTAEVTVELPLYGPGSVSEAILPEVLRETSVGEPNSRERRRERVRRDEEERTPDFVVSGAPVGPKDVDLRPDPRDRFKEPSEPAVRVATAPRVKPVIRPNVEPGLTPTHDRGPFSSVIIDCRGLGVQAILSPKLYDNTGREIYGTVRVDPDFAIETGIVGYPRTMFDALRSKRAGGHPLIVKAIRTNDRNRTDPVITFEDAERLLEANKRDHFFERTRVIFLCDPVR